MKHRFTAPSTLLVVFGVAGSMLVAACSSSSGSGGGKPTPTPATTPLVGCNNGATSVNIAGEPATFARRMPDRGPHSPYIPGRIAVRFTATGTEPEVGQAMARIRASQLAPRVGTGFVVYSIPTSESPQAAAAALASTRGIAEARPVAARYMQVIPDDPDFGLAADMNAPDTTVPVQWDMYKMNMPGTWDLYQGSSGVTIAIIDSGYDANNVDICQKVLASAVFDLTTGVQDTNATVQDVNGHGSNVSGIAAASTNNLTRYAGVGWNTSLLEVRVFPNVANPAAADTDVAAGITWAVAHGAKVINLSLGGPGPCTAGSPEANAISAAVAANVTVVVASGNEGTSTIDAPSNCPGAIAVGASAINDFTNPASPPYPEVVAGFSNYGPGLTLVAPGGDPCVGRPETCTPTMPSDYLQWITNNYSTTAMQFAGHGIFIAGTSQAAPHVAGVAALMYAKKPGISACCSAGSVKSILSSQATGLDDICGSCAQEGGGRIDAQKALANT